MSTPRSQQQPSLAGFPREDFQGFYHRDCAEATGYLRRWCYGAKRSRLQRQQFQFADQAPASLRGGAPPHCRRGALTCPDLASNAVTFTRSARRNFRRALKDRHKRDHDRSQNRITSAGSSPHSVDTWIHAGALAAHMERE